MGSRPLAGLRAAWGVCVLLLGAPLALTAQAPTPAGTRISNVASVRYQEADGTLLNLTSLPVTLDVGQVAGVDLAPPGSGQNRPGSSVVFAHVLRNEGNGADEFSLSTIGPGGWQVTLLADVDGDGRISPADTAITGFIALSPGREAHLLASVMIPSDATPGASATISITARSRFDTTVTDTEVDSVRVYESSTPVSVEKSVDTSRAEPGDIVTYTLRYRIGGSGTLTGFQIVDGVPLHTAYLPGTMRQGDTPLTDQRSTGYARVIDGDGASLFVTASTQIRAERDYGIDHHRERRIVIVAQLKTKGRGRHETKRARYLNGPAPISLIDSGRQFRHRSPRCFDYQFARIADR